MPLDQPFPLAQKDLAHLARLKPAVAGMANADAVTYFMGHGAMQGHAHPASVAMHMAALKRRHPAPMADADVQAAALRAFEALQAVATSYFQHLEPSFQYEIDSSLMAYLAQPGSGKLFADPKKQPSDLPVSITFMGQFIDHDLTKNGTELVNSQTGPVGNSASPFIDLDSVYGPRADQTTAGVPPMTPDGRFTLTKLDASNNAYDVPRDGMGNALLPDGRNDENQLILQVHMLVMRVHNLLVREKGLTHAQARRETIFNWQSVVLNTHQKSVLDSGIFAQVLADLETELAHPGTSGVKYRPVHGKLRMPHEFAIGFRYGHSQLRNAYFTAPGRAFPLFDNLDPGPDFRDLRGGRALTADRAIDWPYFASGASDDTRSNLIDAQVTSAVFNLPESAVPDVPTKFLGNLPQRNLIRSHEIGLTSGEALFDFFFGAGAPGRLTPEQVEPDAVKRRLFHSKTGTAFQTPLWYYVLKEAEIGGTGRLGKLGSRLVGEVVAGGIYYNPESFVREPHWVSRITGSRVVTLGDLITFVTGKDAS